MIFQRTDSGLHLRELGLQRLFLLSDYLLVKGYLWIETGRLLLQVLYRSGNRSVDRVGCIVHLAGKLLADSLRIGNVGRYRIRKSRWSGDL